MRAADTAQDAVQNIAPILWCRGLEADFPDGSRPLKGIDFSVYPGEVVVILGESGAGKTLLSRALYGLEPHIPGMRVSGDRECPSSMAMIFQDPGQYMNPGLNTAGHFREFLALRGLRSAAQAQARARELLAYVGLPVTFMRRKPRQMSGGQQQRVMIALSLALSPSVLFADEAVASLDRGSREVILGLIERLKTEMHLGIVFITHDLQVADLIADRVVVMYAGRIVESRAAADFFRIPLHPYSRALFRAHPSAERGGGRLFEIPGEMPDPKLECGGCAFADRCPYARDRCRTEAPNLLPATAGGMAACHWVNEGWGER